MKHSVIHMVIETKDISQTSRSFVIVFPNDSIVVTLE